MKSLFCFLCFAFLTACTAALPSLEKTEFPAQVKRSAVQISAQIVIDEARNREIPITIYEPADTSGKMPLAIISHGYGGQNTAYSFLANALTMRGYLAVSIQHEIARDEPLVFKGDPRIVRMPNWQRGAANIRYIVDYIGRKRSDVDISRLALIGHSNGGDMSVLYATIYPGQVHALFTLDHLRMPVPRVKNPQICSVRSSDKLPDKGVFPEPDEQKRLHIQINHVNIIHNDMWDGANKVQKIRILQSLNSCLEPQL